MMREQQGGDCCSISPFVTEEGVYSLPGLSEHSFRTGEPGMRIWHWGRLHPALLELKKWQCPLNKRREGDCHYWDPSQTEGEVGIGEDLLAPYGQTPLLLDSLCLLWHMAGGSESGESG